MVSYEEVANSLLQFFPDCVATVIVDATSNILYSTDNWDPSEDIKKVMSGWRGGSAQFVKIQGVKYSILDCSPERLISTNFGKQGHLIGASTPDGNYFMLGYINPDCDDWNRGGYISLARAVAMLVTGTGINDASQIVAEPGTGPGGAVTGAPAGGGAGIDPTLKGEIDGFLQWIKDDQGLSGYISYYIQQNDTTVLGKLATVYNEFRRIFNF
ncbi:MAG: hypothetical protein GY870_11570 [archaeon]|nr:hypothetical protein [archaeon]